MTTIVTINAGDQITNSRADINTNFANLNSDKIETSYLDTDTTLAANSDSKIATQKAVKAYVDSGGNPNASETAAGIVEEATDAEVTAGTATGATGAKLFITPAKLATRLGGIIPEANTFTDDFNRADVELNGNNGWTVRNASSGAAENSRLEVDNNRAEAIGSTQGYAVRALATTGHETTTFPFTFSANVGQQSTGRAYDVQVTLGASSGGAVSHTTFRGSGVNIRFGRDDSNDTSSSASIYDGSTLVAQDTDVNFDYGANFSFSLSIAADGSGSLNVYNSSDLTGTPDTVTWTARKWETGIGGYAGFYIGEVYTDGTGNSNQPFLDNFDFDYYVRS